MKKAPISEPEMINALIKHYEICDSDIFESERLVTLFTVGRAIPMCALIGIYFESIRVMSGNICHISSFQHRVQKYMKMYYPTIHANLGKRREELSLTIYDKLFKSAKERIEFLKSLNK